MATPTIFFPRSLFPPRKVVPDLVAITAGGGRSITAVEQVSTVDAGAWQINMDEIPFASAEQKRVWRAMSAILRGRKNTVSVPLYATDTTPWPIGPGGQPITTVDIVPHADGSYFSDGLSYRVKVIHATVSANAAAGSTEIEIAITDGTSSELQPGHMFSIANRLYGIKAIASQVDAPLSPPATLYTINVLPPLREDITNGEEVEFDDPRCICRLQTDTELRTGADDYMNTTLARVIFVEAVNP